MHPMMPAFSTALATRRHDDKGRPIDVLADVKEDRYMNVSKLGSTPWSRVNGDEIVALPGLGQVGQ